VRRTLGVGLLLLVTGVGSGGAGADMVEAARRGDLADVYHYLRKAPDSVKSTDPEGYTPLHWAAIRGHWEVFDVLLDAGAPVNAVGADGGTPLHWACHHDRADQIARLLDRGADVSVHNRWGRTPLHVAARRGCGNVAALLLVRGADPDALTLEGWTPLHVAYKSGHPDLVTLLLEWGADPDLEDEEGRTPAQSAFQRPVAIELAKDALDEYVGHYSLGPDAVVRVWKQDDRLHLREFAPDEIYPIGRDTFFCRREPWKVEFLRDDAGEVSGIRLHFLRRTVEGARKERFAYVGSRVCAECHLGGEDGGAYLQWLRGSHALAYWRLGSDWAKFLAKRRPEYRDIEEPIREARCLKCHIADGWDEDPLLEASYRDEEGVGCETCHGPGSAYIDPEVMADREAFLARGGRVPDEAVCVRCHRRGDFHFDERLPKIRHTRPRSGDVPEAEPADSRVKPAR